MTSKIYKIPYTDTNSGELSVPRRIFIDDIVDITLIGKRTLEYGKEFNENILHLMEHFACNSDLNDLSKPDVTTKLASVLNNPIEGQLWFSKNVSRLFVYTGGIWKDFNVYNSVAGNSGFLFDGERVPIPADENGRDFALADCAIYVSPITMYESIESFRCSVDSNGYLTCKYTPVNGVERSGHATFIIIGRMPRRLPPPPSPTPTPTPSITPSITPTITPTMTPPPSPTPTVTPSPAPLFGITEGGDIMTTEAGDIITW